MSQTIKKSNISTLEWIAYGGLILATIFFVKTVFLAERAHVGVGDTVVSMEKHIQGGHRRTILMVLSPECPFSIQSLPFYKTILQRKFPLVGVVVAVDTSSSVRLQKKVLEQQEIFVDKVIAIPTQAEKILHVPTLILLDKTSKIKRLWVGLLDEEDQQDVLSEVELIN